MDYKTALFIHDQSRILWFKHNKAKMISDLVRNKGFRPKGAKLCVENFIKTMEFCMEQTGSLPK